jgi:pentatricopeptide repeat protein
MYEDAVKIFEESKRVGYLPSIVTINALLNASAKNGDIKAAEKLFAELLDTGYQPDQALYTTLIKAIYNSVHWSSDAQAVSLHFDFIINHKNICSYVIMMNKYIIININ